MYLKITLRKGSQDTLCAVPLLDGQYIEEEDGNVVTIELGDRDDTTIGQEQYLNTQSDVIKYEITE